MRVLPARRQEPRWRRDDLHKMQPGTSKNTAVVAVGEGEGVLRNNLRSAWNHRNSGAVRLV